MLAVSAWRHKLITLTSAHPVPVLISEDAQACGITQQKLKTGKDIINSIVCLDNIATEVLSQHLIWIPTANWIRTSNYCIINSEKEAKHFRKLPRNKVSHLDSSSVSTYSIRSISSQPTPSDILVCYQKSLVQDVTDYCLQGDGFLLDCFSLALVQS